MGLYFLGEGCLRRDSGKNKWVSIPFSDIKIVFRLDIRDCGLARKGFQKCKGESFWFSKVWTYRTHAIKSIL